jgi:tricorn protease
MVCLLNENSGSDGDIFPWMFRELGLGPLIGKRPGAAWSASPTTAR